MSAGYVPPLGAKKQRLAPVGRLQRPVLPVFGHKHLGERYRLTSFKNIPARRHTDSQFGNGKAVIVATAETAILGRFISTVVDPVIVPVSYPGEKKGSDERRRCEPDYVVPPSRRSELGRVLGGCCHEQSAVNNRWRFVMHPRRDRSTQKP